ncbi:FecR family protein [Prevotella sp.]|uniref:FecR family protein n=1 Tax=Prevotella sp. TaxID=59823 RepID=UPI003DA373F0
MMNSHFDIERLIHNKILGIITAEEQILLDEWLKQSENNRRNYSQMMGNTHYLSERYRQYHKVDIENAWMKFKLAHFISKSKRFYKWTWLYAAAAILIAIFYMAQWLDRPVSESHLVALSPKVIKAMQVSQKSGHQKATLILGNGQRVSINNPVQYDKILAEAPAEAVYQLVTKDANEYWLTLEDGTVVHLNYDTHLKYPVHFSNNSRTVYLEGEAYFKVAKDASRPFRVVTQNGVIKEYGTEFNVNTRTENGITNVVLVEGSISVTANNSRERMLKPGEMAEFKSGQTEIEIKSTDIAVYKAWNEGEYIFNDCRLDELMNVISHWYGIKVKFQTEEISAIRFTGSVDRYGKLESILNAISKVTSLNIEENGHYVIIKK